MTLDEYVARKGQGWSICGQTEQETSRRTRRESHGVGEKAVELGSECVMRFKRRMKFKSQRGVHCEKCC